MSNSTVDKSPILLDFSPLGDQHYDLGDMLEFAFLEGKKEAIEEFKRKMDQGLQTSAAFSGLFRQKLKDINVSVKDMYLRIKGISEFECLVVIKDKDYYSKTKRWKSYKISEELNNSINDVDINFSLMPFSERIEYDNITSEGFRFQYVSKSA